MATHEVKNPVNEQNEYKQMMATEMIERSQLGPMLELYYRKGKEDWNLFDKMIHQFVMHGMTLAEDDATSLTELPHFKQMCSDFEKRTMNRQFAAVRFSIYMHFAMFFHSKQKLVVELI